MKTNIDVELMYDNEAMSFDDMQTKSENNNCICDVGISRPFWKVDVELEHQIILIEF